MLLLGTDLVTDYQFSYQLPKQTPINQLSIDYLIKYWLITNSLTTYLITV